jgi:adenine phosphoribosyltransferase
MLPIGCNAQSYAFDDLGPQDGGASPRGAEIGINGNESRSSRFHFGQRPFRLIVMNLADAIRTIPDFPKKGVMFRDITTLLGDATALSYAIGAAVAPFKSQGVQKVAGIEARGFILGGAMAHQLSCGFVPIRKAGKLPHEVISETYALEYGVDRVEMHKDGVHPGERVLLVDDLIATGGTALAAVNLLRRSGATICGAAFVIDLPDLMGAERLRAEGIAVQTLVQFAGH